MPPAKRVRREATDDWQQLRLYVATPEQEAYELLRPTARRPYSGARSARTICSTSSSVPGCAGLGTRTLAIA